MKWKFYVEQQPWRRNQERLHIVREGGPGQDFEVVNPLAFTGYPEQMPVPDDACALADKFGRNGVRDFLQAALDAAWAMGLRPAAYKDHTLELAATRSHLDDMRAIVATKFDVPLMLRSALIVR